MRQLQTSSVRSQAGQKTQPDLGLPEEPGLSARKLPRSLTVRFISDLSGASSKLLSTEERQSGTPDALKSPVMGPSPPSRLPAIVSNRFKLHLQSTQLEPKRLESPAGASLRDSTAPDRQEAPSSGVALRLAAAREKQRSSLQVEQSPGSDRVAQGDLPHFRITSLSELSSPEETESITSLQEEVESRRSIDTNVDLEPILKSHASFMVFTEMKRKGSQSPHKLSLCEVPSTPSHRIHRQLK